MSSNQSPSARYSNIINISLSSSSLVMGSQSHPVDVFGDKLDKLFPIPGRPLSHSFPLRWPGITAQSGQALADTLKQDFLEHHVFFKDETFHK
jgi:hypothetical protein